MRCFKKKKNHKQIDIMKLRMRMRVRETEEGERVMRNICQSNK
jgi:hypothetical protein